MVMCYNFFFISLQEKGTLVHVASNFCLDVEGLQSGSDINVKPCTGSHTQKWEFSNYL